MKKYIIFLALIIVTNFIEAQPFILIKKGSEFINLYEGNNKLKIINLSDRKIKIKKITGVDSLFNMENYSWLDSLQFNMNIPDCYSNMSYKIDIIIKDSKGKIHHGYYISNCVYVDNKKKIYNLIQKILEVGKN